MTEISTEERFLRHVQKTPCGCWMWTGAKNKQGYGVFRIDGKNVYAHRFSLERLKGAEIANRFACHTCDRPACVNPDHLYSGDRRTNARDAVDRGRYRPRPGEGNESARLTAAQVADIRTRRQSQRKLAVAYGVSQSLISMIQAGLRWPGAA